MMLGRRHTLRPMVEPIESRALLSGGFADASALHSMVRHHHSVAVSLNGTLRGQYSTNSVSSDAGLSYLISGVSFIRGFGLASCVGELLPARPGVEGFAQGNLNLLSARGTLGFRLTALEPQNGTQNLASAYSYQITRGTGVFVGARGGGGSVTLALIQGPRS